MGNVTAQVKSGFWHMPKSFYPIFLVEFWERFAFYGMQSVAVVLFIQQFGLKESEATDLLGSFAGIMYGLMLIGGVIADKLLGLRRVYMLGIVFMMLGYGSFGLTTDIHMLYWGMGMIIIGNVFFKPNAPNFVKNCFAADDPRIDSAYTYFYMSINLGSFFSLILIPIIAHKYSFNLGIALCGIGMGIGLLIYFYFRSHFIHMDNESGRVGSTTNKIILMLLISVIGVVSAYFVGILLGHPLLSKIVLFSVIGIAYLLFWIVRSKVSSGAERKGMLIAFILLMQAVFFLILYMQMQTSLALYAVHNVRTDIFGIQIPALVTQSFNPFYIFLLSPILATWYINRENSGNPVTIPSKFAFGLLVSGISYVILALSCNLYDANGQVSMGWLFFSYGFYSLGELLISAIGLAMVSKLIPGRFGGFAQGMWLLTSAFGQKLGGIISSFAASDGANESNLQILQGYQKLFWGFGIGSLIIGIIFLCFVGKLNRAMKDQSMTSAR